MMKNFRLHRKHFLIFSVVFVLILFLTNPSNKDFDEYLKTKGQTRRYYSNPYGMVEVSYGRTRYFALFSIFEWNETQYQYQRKYVYVGVFKNFILLQTKIRN